MPGPLCSHYATTIHKFLEVDSFFMHHHGSSMSHKYEPQLLIETVLMNSHLNTKIILAMTEQALHLRYTVTMLMTQHSPPLSLSLPSHCGYFTHSKLHLTHFVQRY